MAKQDAQMTMVAVSNDVSVSGRFQLPMVFGSLSISILYVGRIPSQRDLSTVYPQMRFQNKIIPSLVGGDDGLGHLEGPARRAQRGARRSAPSAYHILKVLSKINGEKKTASRFFITVSIPGRASRRGPWPHAVKARYVPIKPVWPCLTT